MATSWVSARLRSRLGDRARRRSRPRGRRRRRRRGRGRRRGHRRRDRLDRDPLAFPRHPHAGVVPRGEEAAELARRQLPVRRHVVAVAPALEAVQRPRHADARDREPARLRRVGGRGEAGQDPGVVAVGDRDPDRAVGLPEVRDRGSQRGVEAAARDEPVSPRRRSDAARRPSRRDPRRPSAGSGSGRARACSRSSAAGSPSCGPPGRSTMLRMIWTSAAVHQSHVFWVVKTPLR